MKTVLCEQPFQVNAVLFHYGLTPIPFTAYSYLKFCCGSWGCLQQVLSAEPERVGGATVSQELYV